MNLEVAPKWVVWLHNPCRLGAPHQCRVGYKITKGPQVVRSATQSLPSWGGPKLQSGGRNQKWPKSGVVGLHNPYHLGTPHRFKAGTKSELAHKWAVRLNHPYPLGGPKLLKAGDKIRSGPKVDIRAT